MKGLMVTLNGEKKVFGPPGKGGTLVFVIAISNNETMFNIYAKGYDSIEDIYYDWINTQIDSACSIELAVLDTFEKSKFSEPLRKYAGKKGKMVATDRLNKYYQLQKELKAKGLL